MEPFVWLTLIGRGGKWKYRRKIDLTLVSFPSNQGAKLEIFFKYHSQAIQAVGVW